MLEFVRSLPPVSDAPSVPPATPAVPASVARVSSGAVAVTLSNGASVEFPLAGGSGWTLSDGGLDLADPSLRLDGTLAP